MSLTHIHGVLFFHPTPPGFLDTRIELPLLALIVGGTVALGTLLCLGALISCMIYKGKKAAGRERRDEPRLPSREWNWHAFFLDPVFSLCSL